MLRICNEAQPSSADRGTCKLTDIAMISALHHCVSLADLYVIHEFMVSVNDIMLQIISMVSVNDS